MFPVEQPGLLPPETGKKALFHRASSEYRVVILPNMVNGNRFAVWFNGS